ncbi:MAG TPA: hypothetical protein PLP88_07380, partial [Bacteroidales bacterium]|nr:hypothetical protein [Bacteroidales bacterium]
AAQALQRFGRRLAGTQGEEVVTLAGQAIRGVALGVGVTAVLQSVAGGIGLAIAGVPFAGLLTGIMQWLTLRKYFSYSGLWIAASTVGWGLCILITVTGIFAFFIGALLYGIITGLTITLITKNRYADNIP